MKDIIIVGGGASGLVAAIYASKRGKKVTIIEKNKDCGKKILITGNGKCNYWNDEQSLEHYHSNNIELVSEFINEKNMREILNLFNSLGIIPKIKDGYYYPYSGQATSIQTALIKECEINNVEFITETEVLCITSQKDSYIIKTNKGTFNTKKVIISTGSKACPKTGSDGLGYTLATSLGHSIIEPLPALVQLKANATYLKEWQGIRSDVSVSLIEDNKLISTQVGEIQLTNYGLSGICIFCLSGQVSRGLYKNKTEQISINFLHPFNINTYEEFINFINKRNNVMKNRTISDLLDGLLNYKLINLLLKLSKIDRFNYWNNLTKEEKYTLYNKLTNFIVDIIDTNSFDMAQTCTGGVPLTEINLFTMESLYNKNLFITGELLDVDGDCGGYNLTNAWITGMLAGIGASND
ncbi:MAG: aminoacetone oxidase family FAD-binding enzyme [Bacilli bacterium]|nr:aminoacetone oxidase family FAD-binding enzyme [Bacilli bacterium]